MVGCATLVLTLPLSAVLSGTSVFALGILYRAVRVRLRPRTSPESVGISCSEEASRPATASVRSMASTSASRSSSIGSSARPLPPSRGAAVAVPIKVVAQPRRWMEYWLAETHVGAATLARLDSPASRRLLTHHRGDVRGGPASVSSPSATPRR